MSGFWTPLWIALPRIRAAIIHDPYRKRRLRILLVGELTVFVTIIAIDDFVRLCGLPFNVLTCEQTWRGLVVGLYFFALSYLFSPFIAILDQKRVQQCLLIYLSGILGMLLPLVFVSLMIIFRFIYPHQVFFHEVLSVIFRGGKLVFFACYYIWLGIWLGVLSLVMKKIANHWKRTGSIPQNQKGFR